MTTKKAEGKAIETKAALQTNEAPTKGQTPETTKAAASAEDIAKAEEIAKKALLAYKEALKALRAMKGDTKTSKEPVPYKQEIVALISEGKHTQKEVLEAVSAKFPEVLKATISTVLSDAKNPKYHSLGVDKVAKLVDGKLTF